MVICVASAKLNGFLSELISHHQEPASKPLTEAAEVETEEKPLIVKGFCLKCKKIKTINKPQQVVMKNMRVMVKGICPQCGAKIATFMPVLHRNRTTAAKKAKGPGK